MSVKNGSEGEAPASQIASLQPFLNGMGLTTTPSDALLVDGYNGAQMVEVTITDNAVNSVKFEVDGTLDGTNWYQIPIVLVATNTAGVLPGAYSPVLADTVASINGTIRRVYQVLLPFVYLRFNPTANTLVATGISAKGYLVPV